MSKTFRGRYGHAVCVTVLMVAAQTANAQLFIPAGGTVTFPTTGQLSLACTELAIQGSLSLSAGAMSDTAGLTIGPTGSFNAGTGTINVSGNWVNLGSFSANDSTVVFNDGCTQGPIAISGTTVFNNLTLSSSSGSTFTLASGSNITVNGTLTLQGTQSNPIRLLSSAPGITVINLGPSARVVQSNAIISPTVQIGTGNKYASIPTLSDLTLGLLTILLAFGAALQKQLYQRKNQPAKNNSRFIENHKAVFYD